MERDGFSCTQCGDRDSTLNVHHWKYAKEPWDASVEDLSTVCEKCHERIEECKRLLNRYIKFSDFRSMIANVEYLINKYGVVDFNMDEDNITIYPNCAQPESPAKSIEQMINGVQNECEPPPWTQQTPMHGIVEFICRLALTSSDARYVLKNSSESLDEAERWVPGIPLLKKIIEERKDIGQPGGVECFLAGLPESDRIALTGEVPLIGNPSDGMKAAEHALELLSGTVLVKRDAAVKAALKVTGLPDDRMIELLEDAKQIAISLQGRRVAREY